MAREPIHKNEITASLPVVQQLIDNQFPDWRHLPIRKITSNGTDNTLLRLEGNLCIRLPRRPEAVEKIAKEYTWLPKFPSLPFAIPRPVALGKPDDAFPYNWAVFEWIEGKNPDLQMLRYPDQFACQLGAFLREFQKTDITGGPVAGAHNNFRGAPLDQRDAGTRQAVSNLSAVYNPKILTQFWNRVLETPAYSGPGVWLHGDIHSGIMLTKGKQVTALIDFGLMGVGDPACDLMIGWTELDGTARAALREATVVDAETWARARGWAFSFAVIALAYYIGKNDFLEDMARHCIGEVLGEME